MNAHQLPEPERWSERAPGSSAEDALGASLRRIRAATEPSSAASLRWAREAMAPAPRAGGRRIWAIAIAAAILGGGGAVAARVAWRAAVTKASAPVPAGDPSPSSAAGKIRRITAHQEPAPVPTAPPELAPVTELAAQTPPALAPATPPRNARATRPAPTTTPPTQPPPPPATETEDEAQLVARAFRHLRNQGDALAALDAPDERERRVGAGARATEAARARAEALLALGRTDEALPILLGVRDPRAGLTPEVRAARAELLARSNRCDEAAADFDELLAPGAP